MMEVRGDTASPELLQVRKGEEKERRS